MSGKSSNRIKDKKERILQLWEDRCLKEVPSAGRSVRLALRDSLPQYLDHLSHALDTNLKMDFKSIFARDQEGERIGKLHGADRASNKSYILTEVIFEYHILREVIFQVLEVEGNLPQIQRDIVLDSIEQAVNDAAVEFTDVHADIQQEFTNTLTHDLKNPITSARINAQMTLRRTDVPQAVLVSSRRIVGNLNRLEAMIHDLLDASRLRAGEQLILQKSQCDLDQVIRGVVDEMSLVHGDRFVFDSSGPVVGTWSGDGLRRAVENLIGNAVKYGSPEAPIAIALRREKSYVEIKVHNEGPSVLKEEIPALFENFRRSKRAHEGTQSGWGLGLTLVRGVVDAHKGKVRVESAQGKGTSFILEIPLGDHQPTHDLKNAG